VEYIIRSRDIRPAGKAGNAFIYAEASVDQIAREISRISADRNGKDANRE